MRKLIFILLFLPMIGICQTATSYELQFFSGTSSYVEVSNASGLIANKSAFTISGWVYPHANPNSHSGLMGFRNNVDADFYLLQLSNSTNIEARFRNSAGIQFDIIANNALDLNQWQHLAFTYDGSWTRLYKDGIILDSVIANGVISQTTEPFRLGGLDWQGTLFHMDGRLDEIRCWDAAISKNIINDWKCITVNSTHPNISNLMGYWKLDEGSGTTIFDYYSFGNMGSLYGGTSWTPSSNCTTPTNNQPSCDSVVISFNQIDSTTMPNLIYFDVQVFGFGPNVGYPGFILLNNLGDTIGYENFNTAANVFTLMPNAIETRKLDVIQNFSLPFNGSIHLVDGWFAGNPTTACIFPFYINSGTTNINETIRKREILKTMDILGRETKGLKNEPLFYIYDDGTVEKRIVIE